MPSLGPLQHSANTTKPIKTIDDANAYDTDTSHNFQGFHHSPVIGLSKSVATTPWSRFKLFNSPFPRYRHAASSITSDKHDIFLMGGLKEGSVFGDTWKISPKINHHAIAGYEAQVIDIVNMQTPPARVGHAAVLCGNAFIVYGGDTVDTDNDGFPDNNFYLFNINNNKYTIPNHILHKPNGRYGHTLQVISLNNSSSRLYLFGGQLENQVYNDLYYFELNTFKSSKAKWELVEPANNFKPPPLTNHSTTVYKSKLYVFGGVYNNEKVSNDLWSFDALTNKWQQIPTSGALPPATNEHSCCVANDKLYIYGGNDFSGVIYSSLYVLDLNTNVWSKLIDEADIDGPGPRCGHTMTFVPKYNKIVIMGGDKNDYVSDDPQDFDTYDTYLGSENGTMLYQLDVDIIDRFLSTTVSTKQKKVAASARTDDKKLTRSMSGVDQGEEFTSAAASPVIKPTNLPDHPDQMPINNMADQSRKSLDPLASSSPKDIGGSSHVGTGIAAGVGAGAAATGVAALMRNEHQANRQVPDEFVDVSLNNNIHNNQIHSPDLNNDINPYGSKNYNQESTPPINAYDNKGYQENNTAPLQSRDLREVHLQSPPLGVGQENHPGFRDVRQSSGGGSLLDNYADSDKESANDASQIAPPSNGLTRTQTTPEGVKQLINELTSELTRLKTTTKAQMQEATERIGLLEEENRQLSNNSPELLSLRQQVQERDDVIGSLKAAVDPRELAIDDDSSRSSIPELGKYKLERMELNNRVLYLQQENSSLKQKHEEFEPFMNNQIGELLKFQKIIQSQEEKIDHLTNQLLDQQVLSKELNEWKVKHQNLELEYNNYKSITNDDVIDEEFEQDVSHDTTDSRSISGGRKRDISGQLETLVTAWNARQAPGGVSRDISGGANNTQQQQVIGQLQKQIDDLLKISKQNDARSSDEINHLRTELEERLTSLKSIEEKYRDALQSVNNTSKALKLNQEETDAQRNLVEKLIRENNELKIFKKASKRVSSRNATPVVEGDPSFPDTIQEGDEDDEEINNAHYNMKVKDLEADLYIIKQERDQLKQNVTSLQKQLYLASQDD